MKSLITGISSIRKKSIVRHLLSGWAIGLVLITLFVFSADDPKPEWGPWWIVRPLIVTPIVSAIGMLSFFLKSIINPSSDLGKIAVFLISLFFFVVALWLGFIMGLDGTMWN